MIYYAEAKTYRMQDGTEYTGYDILGLEAGAAPTRVEDVTEDGRFARLICAALNRERVEPVHLTDILSDILADSEGKNALQSGGSRIY